MPAMTRGPLPPGVYWRRRAFVALLAVTLVFIIASALGGGSDGRSEEAPAAQQAAGQVDASETVTVGERDRKGRKGRGKNTDQATAGPTYDPTVLVEPDGPCDPEDVVVTPTIEGAVAGRDVTIALSMQTVESEACNWKVDPRRVTVKITDGDDEVWSTRQCPRAVPAQEVVVRRIVATVVELTWNARFSDDDCPRATDWVEQGDYTVTAAAYRGEPVSTDFTLVNPAAETVTAEPDPEPERDRKGDRKGHQRGDGGSDDPSENQGEEPVR